VIDLDPQGSLTLWRNTRAAPYPAIVESSPKGLDVALRHLARAGFSHVFIDLPPGYGTIVDSAVAQANLTIIPVKPGELDIDACLKTAAAPILRRRAFAFVPNDGTFRSIAMGKVIRTLQDEKLPLLPTIHHRVDAALVAGQVGIERAPRSRAAEEAASLWAAVRSALKKGRVA
jgi:chromosome partitioning protein